MRRRFVFDPASQTVVELGLVRESSSPAARYADVRGEYDYQFTREASPKAAERLKLAALDRADRREWAHARFGNERRWAE